MQTFFQFQHIKDIKRIMMTMKKCEKMPEIYGSVNVYSNIITLLY